MHERTIWRGERWHSARGAESLRPQGTWQHLNLGRLGSGLFSTAPGLTPTDSCVPGGGAREGQAQADRRVTPCRRCQPPDSSLPALYYNSRRPSLQGS